MPPDSTLVGFKLLVPPINETARRQFTSTQSSQPPGAVLQLLGGGHAPPLGFNLPALIRLSLESRQMSSAQINLYLTQHGDSIKRYCYWQDLLPGGSSVDFVARRILQLAHIPSFQAKNSYTDLLLVAG